MRKSLAAHSDNKNKAAIAPELGFSRQFFPRQVGSLQRTLGIRSHTMGARMRDRLTGGVWENWMKLELASLLRRSKPTAELRVAPARMFSRFLTHVLSLSPSQLTKSYPKKRIADQGR